MSVARPTETGCRLVRIKRVPSSEFQSQYPISRNSKNQQPHYLPPITLRNTSSAPSVNRIWINQRHSDAWLCGPTDNRFSSIDSPHYHQVFMILLSHPEPRPLVIYRIARAARHFKSSPPLFSTGFFCILLRAFAYQKEPWLFPV